MEQPIDYMALEYDLELPWIMSFLLVPHLSLLIGWGQRTAVADRQTKKLYIDITGFRTVVSVCLSCHCLIYAQWIKMMVSTVQPS